MPNAPPQSDCRAEPGRPLPEFDAERCVHSLIATASCRACIDACPRAALIFSDDSIGLDTEACDGCALCRPACPEGAVTCAPDPAVRDGSEPAAASAFAACDKVAPPGRDGTVACIHSIGLRELGALEARGVARLIVASGDCSICSRQPSRTLWQAAEQAIRIAAGKGKASLLVQRRTPDQWRSDLAHATSAEPAIDRGRRGFLGLGRKSAPPDRAAPGPARQTPVEASAPHIDASRCSGCDACVRICPHRALLLEASPAGRHYRTQPANCTGCRLCADVCPDAAIAIEPMSAFRQAVPLAEARCRTCGVDFHFPETRKPRDTCPICESKRHRSALFLVNDRKTAQR